MARARTSSDAELLVELRRDDAVPLHRQLERELRAAVRSGRLGAGSVVPSTRGLASQLGLSRGVVVEAYEQLVAEGYLVSQPGGTTRVSERVSEASVLATGRPAAPAFRIDFGYGRPDVAQFPRATWMRSLRRVLNEAPSDRLAYLDRRGAEELRVALADYLNRVRGTCAEPDRVVICNGFAQAVVLVTQALKARGRSRIAVEDPSQQDDFRQVAAILGLTAIPVPVDGDGIRVDALARTDTDLVVVTPAHQFPTGAVLSPERRAALVRWAVEGNRRILEDDYDAEYRYDREPIGALHGLAPEHVIYAGSASKTLAPGLRLGWVIAPGDLVDDLAAIKEAVDRGSPSLEQLAFADFLARGEFDHHLRRMRPIYRARRDALLDAIRRYLPGFEPAGASAGLHVIAWLPPGVAETPLVERAAAEGVGIYGLARYHDDPATARPGLLFGYGRVTEAEIDEGIRVVASALG
jgi:GntR family transcriptional regulator / MocR family aminotransferase